MSTVLYAVVPYAAVVAAVALPVVRWVRGATSPAPTRTLRDRLPLVIGATVVAALHLVGLLLARPVSSIVATPAALLVFEAVGLLGGLLLLWGLLAEILHAVRAVRGGEPGALARAGAMAAMLVVAWSGVYVALALRWSSAWYLHVAVPYLESLGMFRPAPGMLATAPFAVQLHVLGGFAVLPLVSLATRLGLRKPAAVPAAPLASPNTTPALPRAEA